MSDAIRETTAEEASTEPAIVADPSADAPTAAVWSFGRSLAPAAPPPEEQPAPPPKLDNAAYHGLAGQIVNTIIPHTEGDPAALLVLLLMGLGSVVGRSPHFEVEATDHYLNLFAVLVGNTAKARKGTVTDRIKHLHDGTGHLRSCWRWTRLKPANAWFRTDVKQRHGDDSTHPTSRRPASSSLTISPTCEESGSQQGASRRISTSSRK